MKAKGKHGGKRPGSGRKPNVPCAVCTVLEIQLAEARRREAKLLRMLESKDGQVGAVIHSKFDTVRIEGQTVPEPSGPVMPIDALLDVTMQDDEFISKTAEMTQ
jgi:hypothetical protein